MIIDTHQHVFWHYRNDADLVADMDAHGIDVAWLLTWEISPAEWEPQWARMLNPVHANPDGTNRGVPLSDLLLTHSRYPGRFVVGYCPHPAIGDAPALFESAYHMHRVRVCGEWKFRMPFDDPRCIALFQKAGELKCPVVLHLDVQFLADKTTGQSIEQKSWFGGDIDNLERALGNAPKPSSSAMPLASGVSSAAMPPPTPTPTPLAPSRPAAKSRACSKTTLTSTPTSPPAPASTPSAAIPLIGAISRSATPTASSSPETTTAANCTNS